MIELLEEDTSIYLFTSIDSCDEVLNFINYYNSNHDVNLAIVNAVLKTEETDFIVSIPFEICDSKKFIQNNTITINNKRKSLTKQISVNPLTLEDFRENVNFYILIFNYIMENENIQDFLQMDTIKINNLFIDVNNDYELNFMITI